ncbi:uncharacterized protein [Haliotis asinina]|uniref:uncharacterized protein n=1 Tax=Haliotis asinina TaxID=109174 RepID=UPI003531B136
MNCSSAHQPFEVRSDKNSDLFAVRYRHGWTINGPVHVKHNEENDTVVCNRIVLRPVTKANECMSEAVLKMFEQDFSENDQGKCPGELGLSVEDKRFMEIVKGQHCFTNGHFQVPPPFKKLNQTMPYNREIAVTRALGQEKKMLRDESYYRDYVSFIDSLLQKGYARKIPPAEHDVRPGRVWYLPHHGIYHPKKPNKIRVVFDCSTRCKGVCLNDVLLQGPDLTNSLLGVLLRFRTDRIAFMGNIDAMFHQVRLPQEHQDFFRFVWWPNGNLDSVLEEYCMTVQVFGSVSSPSIANFALKDTADKSENKYDESVTETLRRNVYVDDCLKSVDTEDNAIILIKGLQSACLEDGFRLAKFVGNSKKGCAIYPS